MVFNKEKYWLFRAMILGVLIMPAMADTVFAHKFIASAWVEENSVFIESAFGTGEPGINAEVIVFDNMDNKLLTAATDENGECNFKIPKKSALKIIVKAGMGHQAKVDIALEDIEAAFGEQSTPAAQTSQPAPGTANAAGLTASAPVAGVSAQQIQEIIDNSLDKKLKPLIRKLSVKDTGGPEFKDIAAGIGYIFGLVGVGTYFNYRRKQQN